MSLGSRYTVASGGNEHCFVPWLIYTWPWRGSFSFSGCSIALPFTFPRPCDRLTSKQIPGNYRPLGKEHHLFFVPVSLFIYFPLSGNFIRIYSVFRSNPIPLFTPFQSLSCFSPPLSPTNCICSWLFKCSWCLFIYFEPDSWCLGKERGKQINWDWMLASCLCGRNEMCPLPLQVRATYLGEDAPEIQAGGPSVHLRAGSPSSQSLSAWGWSWLICWSIRVFWNKSHLEMNLQPFLNFLQLCFGGVLCLFGFCCCCCFCFCSSLAQEGTSLVHRVVPLDSRKNEAGGLQMQGRSWLQREFKDTLDNLMRVCPKCKLQIRLRI